MEVVVLIVAIAIGALIFKKVKDKQTVKGTSKGLVYLMSTSALFVTFMVIMVLGFALFIDTPKVDEKSNVQITKKMSILSISDFNYTMKDKQAVSISFGTSQSEYFTVTIHRDKIKQDVNLQKNKNNYINTIDGEANFNKKHYVFFVKNGLTPYINFNVKTIDYKSKQATIIVSAKLYNPNDNSEIVLKKQEFRISNKLFDNLTKIIK